MNESIHPFIQRGKPSPRWESESCSVVSDSLQHHGLYSPWNSPGQNTGVGCLSLLQGIFPTQGLNPGLLHCRWILYQLSYQGSWERGLPISQAARRGAISRIIMSFRRDTHRSEDTCTGLRVLLVLRSLRPAAAFQTLTRNHTKDSHPQPGCRASHRRGPQGTDHGDAPNVSPPDEAPFSNTPDLPLRTDVPPSSSSLNGP